MTMPADPNDPSRANGLLVHAYLDGELSSADTAAAKRQIEADPALTNQLAAYATLQTTLRTRMPREQVSPLLLARIDAAVRGDRQWTRPTWRALAASVAVALALSSVVTWLGIRVYRAGLEDNRVTFPRDLGVHYATIETMDDVPGGRYRELYAQQATLDAVKAGKPPPYGAVLVRAIYDVQRGADGAPAKGPDGHLTKTKLLAVNVMEKQAGWGGKFPAGEWDFQSFAPDGTRRAQPAAASCFACHDTVRNQDFVFGLDRMKAAPGQRASIWRTLVAALYPR